MADLLFPAEWFTPTPEAHRAAAALAEGFCAFPHCGYPFDAGMFCPVCEVTWSLSPSGFSGQASLPDGSYRTLTVYPFAAWQQPVIDLGAWGG